MTDAELPPHYRLALGHAPPALKGDFAALFLLDHRLARAALEASEPIIAQMKLAWWRDRFAKDVSEWPAGEPLLESLSAWGDEASALGGLVDGWEAVGVGQGPDAANELVAGRHIAWTALARRHAMEAGAERIRACASSFTFAALKQDDLLPAQSLVEPMRGPAVLPRALRPFALLGALGDRSLRTGRPLLGGLPALALALRVGLTGR